MEKQIAALGFSFLLVSFNIFYYYLLSNSFLEKNIL